MKDLSSKLRQLKSYCRWLKIEREFYLGLYQSFGHLAHKARYYYHIHWHISHRGRKL